MVALDRLNAVCVAAGLHFAVAVETSPGEVFTVGHVPDCACLTMRLIAVAMKNGGCSTDAILASRDAFDRAANAPT
jgi:hypothetical protein